MRTLLTISCLIIVIYVGVVFTAYLFQRKLQYSPSPEHVSPVLAGLHNVQEVVLVTPDAQRLIAWYAPAQQGKPTILYFHGNGGGLIDRVHRIAKYQALGFGFFIAAYRSYAGSTGIPTEEALVADAHLAYDYLVKQKINPERIVVFGESLGTSVATQLVSSVKTGALVLESPFTSAVDVGALIYPYLPVRWLMKDQYLTDQYIRKVNVPVLVVHGGQDQLIPLMMGKKMFELANDPKEFVFLPQAGHNDHDQFGLVPKVQAFIERFISAH